MRVWRLGHKKAPCDFVPRRLCHWRQRFDDPQREYRTLYCAEKDSTCLYEVLADLRPNPKARAEFSEMFDADEELAPKPSIHKWRKDHVLAQAKVMMKSDHIFIPVEEFKVRHQLEKLLADILKREKIEHLNIHELRSKNRHVTQAISRTVYEEWESAGIEFRSRLDKCLCYALFEGRAYLQQIGKAISLDEDVPLLAKVCDEYGLSLDPN